MPSILNKLTEWRRRLRNAMGWVTGRGAVIPRENWDAQYARGHWDFIGEESERYDALTGEICAVLNSFPPQARVVWDLGCGEGWMLGALAPKAPPELCYRGFDLSKVAIAQALKRWEKIPESWPVPSVSWEVGDMEDLLVTLKKNTVEADFPAVVLFNESIHYLADPLKIWQEWGVWLRQLPGPRRTMLASMYEHPRTRVLRRKFREKNLGSERKVGQWTLIRY